MYYANFPILSSKAAVLHNNKCDEDSQNSLANTTNNATQRRQEEYSPQYNSAINNEQKQRNNLERQINVHDNTTTCIIVKGNDESLLSSDTNSASLYTNKDVRNAPASSQRHLSLHNPTNRSTLSTTTTAAAAAAAAMSYPSLLYYSSSSSANTSKVPLCVQNTSPSTSLSRNAFPLLSLSTSLRETEAHEQHCAITNGDDTQSNNKNNTTILEAQTHSPYVANWQLASSQYYREMAAQAATTEAAAAILPTGEELSLAQEEYTTNAMYPYYPSEEYYNNYYQMSYYVPDRSINVATGAAINDDDENVDAGAKSNTFTAKKTIAVVDDVCNERNVNNQTTSLTNTLDIAHEENEALPMPSAESAVPTLNWNSFPNSDVRQYSQSMHHQQLLQQQYYYSQKEQEEQQEEQEPHIEEKNKNNFTLYSSAGQTSLVEDRRLETKYPASALLPPTHPGFMEEYYKNKVKRNSNCSDNAVHTIRNTTANNTNSNNSNTMVNNWTYNAEEQNIISRLKLQPSYGEPVYGPSIKPCRVQFIDLARKEAAMTPFELTRNKELHTRLQRHNASLSQPHVTNSQMVHDMSDNVESRQVFHEAGRKVSISENNKNTQNTTYNDNGLPTSQMTESFALNKTHHTVHESDKALNNDTTPCAIRSNSHYVGYDGTNNQTDNAHSNNKNNITTKGKVKEEMEISPSPRRCLEKTPHHQLTTKLYAAPSSGNSKEYMTFTSCSNAMNVTPSQMGMTVSTKHYNSCSPSLVVNRDAVYSIQQYDHSVEAVHYPSLGLQNDAEVIHNIAENSVNDNVCANNTQRSLALMDNSTDTTLIVENEENYPKKAINSGDNDKNDEVANNKVSSVNTNNVSCVVNEPSNNNSSVCEMEKTMCKTTTIISTNESELLPHAKDYSLSTSAHPEHLRELQNQTTSCINATTQVSESSTRNIAIAMEHLVRQIKHQHKSPLHLNQMESDTSEGVAKVKTTTTNKAHEEDKKNMTSNIDVNATINNNKHEGKDEINIDQAKYNNDNNKDNNIDVDKINDNTLTTNSVTTNKLKLEEKQQFLKEFDPRRSLNECLMESFEQHSSAECTGNEDNVRDDDHNNSLIDIAANNDEDVQANSTTSLRNAPRTTRYTKEDNYLQGTGNAIKSAHSLVHVEHSEITRYHSTRRASHNNNDGLPEFIIIIKGHYGQRAAVFSHIPWNVKCFVIFDSDRGIDLGQVVQCISRFSEEYTQLMDLAPSIMSCSSTSAECLSRCESLSLSPSEVVVVTNLMSASTRRRSGTPMVLRTASTDEQQNWQHHQTEAAEHTLPICQAAIRELHLPLTIVAAVYQFNMKKLTFFYKSNVSVDFRQLVRTLFAKFHCRIWMERAEDAAEVSKESVLQLELEASSENML